MKNAPRKGLHHYLNQPRFLIAIAIFLITATTGVAGYAWFNPKTTPKSQEVSGTTTNSDASTLQVGQVATEESPAPVDSVDVAVSSTATPTQSVAPKATKKASPTPSTSNEYKTIVQDGLFTMYIERLPRIGVTKFYEGEVVRLKPMTTNQKTCSWDFGDGTTADGCDVTHTYPICFPSCPEYTVKLYVTTNTGEKFLYMPSSHKFSNIGPMKLNVRMSFSGNPTITPYLDGKAYSYPCSSSTYLYSNVTNPFGTSTYSYSWTATIDEIYEPYLYHTPSGANSGFIYACEDIPYDVPEITVKVQLKVTDTVNAISGMNTPIYLRFINDEYIPE